MVKRNSPSRRRSIAVLGHGQAKTTSRRRAYSIAPGERMSPAAKARRLLAPRKSILKGSINIPSQHGRASDATESSTSAITDDNMTQTMNFTAVHGQGPRKSLARRVSFAAHTHVRLFHKDSPDGASQGESPSPAPPDPPPAFITRAENDENAIPGPSQAQRRVSFRRRSSGVYSEFGERSMDMDMDDTAPLPRDFLNHQSNMADGPAIEDDGSLEMEEEESMEEDDDGSDMEVTEAIALNIQRKRSLSLGGKRTSLGRPIRPQPSIATASQQQSENISPAPEQAVREEGESFEGQGDMSMSSAQTESSFVSEGSSGEPMEFTIPVLQSMRQPREPDPLWLQLRAVTHAGSEPYEPPPPESDDDAVMIQPSPGDSDAPYRRQSHARFADEEDDGGERDMDLTAAMSRLQQARASLGLGAPTLSQEDESFSTEEQRPQQEQGIEEQMADDTFSTEDSMSMGDDSADLDNRTINFTQRTSLGTLSTSRDEEDEVIRAPVTPAAGGYSPPAVLASPAVVEPNSEASPLIAAPAPLARSLLGSVFSAPGSEPPGPGVFSALGSSSVFSVPTPATVSKVPSTPPRSPSKSPRPATIPKPFAFSLPRAVSPSKIPTPSNSSIAHPPHRGTAAFAPPSVPKSPKRPVSDAPRSDTHAASPATRPAVGRLSSVRMAAFEHPNSHISSAPVEATGAASQPVAGADGNRRTSAVRRPAGYFAQRKSLGAGVLPPSSGQTNAGEGSSQGPGRASLRSRASMGAQPSNVGLVVPLARTHSDPGPIDRAGTAIEGALYPDLTQLTNESEAIRSGSPSTSSARDKEPDRGTVLPVIFPPGPAASASPRTASPAPADAGKTARPGPAAMAPPRSRPVTHIEKPASTRVIDVSMAMDIDQDASLADGSAAVSQAWREGVPEEPPQDDDDPAISIEQFFQMTGIRFMDELTMPKSRRSTVLPGQLRPRARRRSSTTRDLNGSAAGMGESHVGGEDEEAIPLAEFAVAMAVDMPRLDLYGAVARDLNAYIQECKKIYREAEEEAMKVTPSLFREFASVDEAEQAMLIHQLKLIKANNIGTAKSQWYDWKLQWVEQLYETAAQGFTNLESDATYLAEVIKEAQDILPALREEYAEVTRQLEQEQADIDEIENSDKDYLNELKSTIAEQSSEIEAFRADVSEGKAKLERLDEKLSEIEAQKEEATTAISQAKHTIHIQKESTSSEVFRLKEELEALQDLHLWRTAKHTRDLIEFVYASKFHVSLPCQGYKPILSRATIVQTKQSKQKERDRFPQLTDLALKTARSLLVECEEELESKQVRNPS
ncbi:Spc7 kinetochore protein-domain-containing protein [Trametes elegans]|nr:Spc7 kinetochore protein-domain-containing protein [Trametes elegans]